MIDYLQQALVTVALTACLRYFVKHSGLEPYIQAYGAWAFILPGAFMMAILLYMGAAWLNPWGEIQRGLAYY